MKAEGLIELVQDALAPFGDRDTAVSCSGGGEVMLRDPLTGMERTLALCGRVSDELIGGGQDETMPAPTSP